MGGRIVRHKRIAPAPLRYVLRKDVGTLRHELIADKETALREEAAYQRGLTARRCAHIQHKPVGRGVLRQHLPQEHGRCLLHIIRPGVEQRVKRKLRPLRQIAAVRTPRHGPPRRGYAATPNDTPHLTAKPYAHRRFALQSRQELLRLRAQQRAHTVYKPDRQSAYSILTHNPQVIPRRRHAYLRVRRSLFPIRTSVCQAHAWRYRMPSSAPEPTHRRRNAPPSRLFPPPPHQS